MNSPWIVLGGWSIPPEILTPVFGEQSIYIDSNEIVPLLINEDTTLKPDWMHIVKSKLQRCAGGDIKRIAGWSMGAIMALGASSEQKQIACCCLSGTLSFCRRPDSYPFGQPPSAARAMRKGLVKNASGILQNFYRKAGIKANLHTAESAQKKYSPESLQKGLLFLEQAHITPKNVVHGTDENSYLFIHGAEDTIISSESGKYAAERVSGRWNLIEGGHAFFTENDQATQIIRQFGASTL